jgi:hypothetical protein
MNDKDYRTWYGCPAPEQSPNVQVLPKYPMSGPQQPDATTQSLIKMANAIENMTNMMNQICLQQQDTNNALARVIERSNEQDRLIYSMQRRIDELEMCNRQQPVYYYAPPPNKGFFGSLGNAIDGFVDAVF